MSDNLRTRIATAIYMQEYPKRCEHCPTPHPSPWAYKVADAVIEALGLEVTVTAKASDGRFGSFSIEGYWEERVGDV